MQPAPTLGPRRTTNKWRWLVLFLATLSVRQLWYLGKSEPNQLSFLQTQILLHRLMNEDEENDDIELLSSRVRKHLATQEEKEEENKDRWLHVTVLSVWTQYPEMMKWHVASLRAYLRHPFRYVAVLNSRDDNMNRVLARVASRLPEVTFLTMMGTSRNHRLEGDASKHHTNAIREGIRFVSRRDSPVPVQDVLFLLDSDMYLTEPTNVTTGVLRNGAHVASVLQTRDTVSYLWPNFCVLRLPHRDDYAQLDFAPAMWLNHQDGSLHSLDSGGSTVIFLNQNPHLRIQNVRTDSVCLNHNNNEPTQSSSSLSSSSSSLCRFQALQLSEESSMHRPPQCRTAEILSAALEEEEEKQHACGTTTTTNKCPAHFYHLGSAASNWRGCPEQYLQDRRREWRDFMRQSMRQQLLQLLKDGVSDYDVSASL